MTPLQLPGGPEIVVILFVLGIPLLVLGGLAYLLFSRTGGGDTSRRVETLEEEVAALRETVDGLESEHGDDSDEENRRDR